ncbi:ultraviolet-B receptor UVR8 [Rosa rugosa]|uniref:ultraviolet-B receptor UVR8 n=1 Tax=Rosa rugosa TaxID=74645 RepID=UPI002B410C3E|nr:ultraviolet-B receptor UVR8 [Rosa rugosa]
MPGPGSLVKNQRLVNAVVQRFQRCMTTTAAVMSFGDGNHGALGLPTSLMGLGVDAYEPTRVPSLPPDITSVTAGHYHSLAVTSEGQLWAWGRDLEAQLGRGGPSPRDSWNEPRRVTGLDQVNVCSAFASGVISAAIGDDGSFWVWGKSKRGQLGLGEQVMEAVVPSRVEALAGEKITKVALGWGHALALTEDGKLFGWGYFADGRLGSIKESLETSQLESTSNNQELSSSSLEAAEKLVLGGMAKENNMPIVWEPSLVRELQCIEVVDIACGLDHSLILCGDGTLLSCGSNVYGQLGREKQDVGLFPVDISFRPMSIAAGLGHSLAICQVPSSDVIGGAAGVITWGWNQTSQLGRDGPENIPLGVEGLEGETPVSVAGGRVHSIALTSKREVWVWGSGKNGRLGLGSSCDEPEPILLDSVEGCDVLQAVSGFDHNLLLIAE